MGYTRAAEMIQYAGFEPALRDHLQHNLFPPVAANDDLVAQLPGVCARVADGEGDYDDEAIVAALRLDAFVDFCRLSEEDT